MKSNFKKIIFRPQRDNIVDMYLKDIKKTNPDADKEKDLVSIYYSETSTPEEKTAARNEIVAMNQRYVFSIAKLYAGGNNELLMDLVNEGNLGLIEAFSHYDIETGNRFCTFAKHYIIRSMVYFLGNDNLTVRPTNNMKLGPKVKKIEEDFEKANARKPSVDEVKHLLKEKYDINLKSTADIIPVYVDTIDYLPEDINDTDVLSSKRYDFDYKTRVNNDYDEQSEKEGIKFALSQAMSVLNERETTVIKMAFGMDGYLKEYKNFEIGEALGMSSERIRQIKNEAISKLQRVCAHMTSI